MAVNMGSTIHPSDWFCLAPCDRSCCCCCCSYSYPCCRCDDRAHYSAGQIFALQGQWAQSEASYRACAQLAAETASQAQALYCVGVACHQQSSYAAAVEAYSASSAAGPPDNLLPMLALGTARALKQLGQASEAAAVADRALKSQWASLCAPPVMQALRELAMPSSSPASGVDPS